MDLAFAQGLFTVGHAALGLEGQPALMVGVCFSGSRRSFGVLTPIPSGQSERETMTAVDDGLSFTWWRWKDIIIGLERGVLFPLGYYVYSWFA